MMIPKYPHFIVGTGRSGTSILAVITRTLFNFLYYGEITLFAHPGGISDYVNNKISKEDFRKIFLTKFSNMIIQKMEQENNKNALNVFSKEFYSEILEKSLAIDNKVIGMQYLFDTISNTLLKSENKAHWLVKTPENITCSDTIYKIYPNMKMINIIRDPRDIYCSFKQYDFASHLRMFCKIYKASMFRGYHAKKNIPENNYLVISQEELLKKPVEIFKLIAKFYEIALSPQEENKLKKIVTNNISVNLAHKARWKQELNRFEVNLLEKEIWNIYSLWQDEELRSYNFWGYNFE